MLDGARAIMNLQEQSRTIRMSFACFEMNAGSVTPSQRSSIAEASMITLASFFVPALLATLLLLVLVRLVLVRGLTGFVHSLVGLTAQRAAGQGV